jgi:hypothetical protein
MRFPTIPKTGCLWAFSCIVPSRRTTLGTS